MADIQQIRSQVSSACARYKEDQSKMQSASSEMSRFQDQAERAERQLDRVDDEIGDIEDEIRRLESQASQSVGEEGSDVSSIYGRISDLRYRKQDLMQESARLENEMSQARANYQRARSVYDQAQNDANKVRNYLEQIRSAMNGAAQTLERKIAGFDQTSSILGSAAGNMLGSAALSQMGRIQTGRNEYQNNLNITKEIISQIASTIGGSGYSGGMSGSGYSAGGYASGGSSYGSSYGSSVNSITSSSGFGGRSSSSSVRSTPTYSGPPAAQMRAYADDWIKGLSAPTKSAINDYTKETPNFYKNINGVLRGLQDSYDPGNAERSELIHQALSNASTPCDMTVYRGCPSEALGDYAFMSDSQLVGGVFIDKGFASTSMAPEGAFNNDVLLVINLPKGSHASNIEALSAAGGYEQEVLLDRGQLFQITNVTRDSFGRRVVHVNTIN